MILIDVDYVSCRKALIETQKYSPFEIGLGRLVNLQKENFVGRAALIAEQKRRGPARSLAGLELDWNSLEKLYQDVGLAPQVPSTASRLPVPVYKGRTQIGKATSTTWSPTLKKMIALASVETEHSKLGTQLQMEITIEAIRLKTNVKVTATPFFNPARKTAVPA